MSKLREILSKATPGPWGYDGFAVHDKDNEVYVAPNPILRENAELIVTLVNAAEEIADLMDAVREVGKQEESLFSWEGGPNTNRMHATLDALDKKLNGETNGV